MNAPEPTNAATVLVEESPPYRTSPEAQNAIKTNPTPTQDFPWRFNSQSSKLYAAKSIATRKRLAAEREERRKQPVHPSLAKPLPTDDYDPYVKDRLSRTRKHIEELDIALEKAREPLDRERLARALAQLCEVERILAGRPLPGSHRPTGRSRSSSDAAIRTET
jgi:hypothetical protein